MKSNLMNKNKEQYMLYQDSGDKCVEFSFYGLQNYTNSFNGFLIW